MIGPSKINNGGIPERHFHTVCPCKPRIRLNFGARARKTPNLIIYFLAHCRKLLPPAPEFSALKQRGRA
jgi:hypothetical protein